MTNNNNSTNHSQNKTVIKSLDQHLKNSQQASPIPQQNPNLRTLNTHFAGARLIPPLPPVTQPQTIVKPAPKIIK